MEESQGLKEDNVIPITGQVEKDEVPQEAPVTEEPKAAEEATEDIEQLPSWAKDRFKKLEEERENYKKGMLKYKEKTLSVEPEEKAAETAEEIAPEWDEASKKFQQQTLSEAEKRAEKKVQEIIAKNNEKAAIAQFLSKHPELEDEKAWKEVIGNYNPKYGKESPDSVLKDLDRAYILTRYEKGDLTKDESKKAQSQIADLTSISKTTSKSGKDGKNLSEGAIRLAQRMKVDPKKLAEEDDSAFAEIKL